MLWTIFVILLILWLLGVVSSYTTADQSDHGAESCALIGPNFAPRSETVGFHASPRDPTREQNVLCEKEQQ